MANRAFLVLRSAIKVSGRGIYYPAAFRMRRLAAFYNHSAACVCAVPPMVCLIKLPAFGRRMAGSRDYDRCFVGYLYAAISILEPHIAAVAGIVGLIAALGAGRIVGRNKLQAMLYAVRSCRIRRYRICYRRRIHAPPSPPRRGSVCIHANACFRPCSNR